MRNFSVRAFDRFMLQGFVMPDTTKQWTVLQLINWTKDYFPRKGVDEPRLSAEVLLSHVLGCKRVKLYTQFDRVVESEHLDRFRELVRRAAAGEPVAYLVGMKEFYSLTIRLSPDVLIPRPETELLVDVVLEYARSCSGEVKLWDVCTGSGCVAVAAAYNCDRLIVLATDISTASLEIARQNVQQYQLERRIRLAKANLLDLPQNAQDMPPFDVITANPPYVSKAQMEKLPPAVRYEPALALYGGVDGLDFIRRIISQAADYLRPGGVLAIEIGFDQAERVYDLLCQTTRYERITFLKDLAGRERVALAYKTSDE